jgi:hypothetical protein
MAQLTDANKPSPTRQSVKRLAKNTGGASSPKEMGMSTEPLASAKDLVPQLSGKGSSREQMEELARVYQLKINAAKNKARGMSSDTFGAPTLEGPSLTKNSLAKKRFNKGGEAKKSEGEPSQEELDAASRPAFVTPKSGKGRKISSKPGELEAAALQGVSEMPYNLLGTPVDLATMAMRPFGYNVEAPMFGSEDLKRRATKAGIRQEPPKEGTAARALFNLADIGSSAVNPAAPVRAGVKAAQAVGDKASAVAKDFQEYNRQLAAPGASYAVRPTGSTMASGPIGFNTRASGVDQLLNDGVSNARSAAGQDADMENRIKSFWDTKARNYFTRQFGTPDDPVMDAIAKKRIKSVGLEEMFPEYMLDQITVGKTRINEQGQERFFPKYPRAMDDFAARYDPATGLKGNVISTDPAMANPEYEYVISAQGEALARSARAAEADRMSMQGLRPELINTNLDLITRSGKNPDRIIGGGTRSAQDLFRAFEESQAYNKLTPEQQRAWANEQFGMGRNLQGLDYPDVSKNILPDSVRTAIEKGEPVYDFDRMDKPLKALFEPASINAFLTTVPEREMKNMRFEDAVAGAVKMNELATQRQVMVDRIKAGKSVPNKVFSDGVSEPLLKFGEGSGLDGFAWKRIEKREATVPEGAYVGHSVGGYETGGIGYTQERRDGFNTGLWKVYTLRDNRNRPVNTIEVKMRDEFTPVVTQIKGNGAKTGNVPATKYDGAVLRFLQTYLKPAAIEERDELLTPLLQDYKVELGRTPRNQ